MRRHRLPNFYRGIFETEKGEKFYGEWTIRPEELLSLDIPAGLKLVEFVRTDNPSTAGISFKYGKDQFEEHVKKLEKGIEC